MINFLSIKEFGDFIRKKILPFIPVAALFFHFALYDVFTEQTMKSIWLVMIIALLFSDFSVDYLIKKNITRGKFIPLCLGGSAFFLYHLRDLLDIVPKPGVSPDALYLPKIREFLLLLIFILSLAFLIYVILAEIGKRSLAAQTELGNKKQNLLLNAVINLMILLPALILVNYLAIIKNYNFDLSKEGKFSLSEPSRKLLKNLTKEIEITGFYPRPLEASGPDRSLALTMIRPDVEILFDQLKSVSPYIKIRFINADVETADIAEYGQVSNGSIIIRSLKKKLDLNDDPYAKQMISIREKNDLETMERKIVQAILNVSAGEKKIYFTVAHGERYSIIFNNLPNEKIAKIEEALKFLNYRIVSLGLDLGWPGKIPADADAVAIVGPTVPFDERAKQEILNYVFVKKGSLIVMIDPKGQEKFNWLLGKAGLKYNEVLLSQFKDKPGIIMAKNFLGHSISESVSKKILGTVMPITGSFVANGEKNSAYLYQSIIETGQDAYSDKNQDGIPDAKDAKGSSILAVQILPKPKGPEKKTGPGVGSGNTKLTDAEFHLLIFSSTSWITDQYIYYNANPQLAVSSFTWLNQEQIIADIPEKKDEIKQIALTENQKLGIWLFGLFIYPGFIFALGTIFIARRRKKK